MLVSSSGRYVLTRMYREGNEQWEHMSRARPPARLASVARLGLSTAGHPRFSLPRTWSQAGPLIRSEQESLSNVTKGFANGHAVPQRERTEEIRTQTQDRHSQGGVQVINTTKRYINADYLIHIHCTAFIACLRVKYSFFKQVLNSWHFANHR